MRLPFKYIQHIVLVLVLCACSSTKLASTKANLQGHIVEFTLNTMPMKGKPPSKGIPLKTEIYIYEATSVNQVDRLEGSFCQQINTKLITRIPSDSLGNFQTYLMPGKYSVLVGYGGAYYIPYFSGANWIGLFEIKANEITNLDINVHSNSNYQ